MRLPLDCLMWSGLQGGAAHRQAGAAAGVINPKNAPCIPHDRYGCQLIICGKLFPNCLSRIFQLVSYWVCTSEHDSSFCSKQRMIIVVSQRSFAPSFSRNLHRHLLCIRLISCEPQHCVISAYHRMRCHHIRLEPARLLPMA